MHNRFKNLKKQEKGQGLVEYALILVLVAIVVIAALMILGPIIGNVFSKINSSLGGLSQNGSIPMQGSYHNDCLALGASPGQTIYYTENGMVSTTNTSGTSNPHTFTCQ